MSPQPTVDPSNLLDGLDIEIPAGTQEAAGAEAPHFFGPYQLIQQVGRGGAARVVRARHIHPRYADTTFAIKILHPELSNDPQVVSLFRHEAYVLSLLKHPNIIQTFEAGSQDGELFIAMEYVDGRDLDNMLVRAQRTSSPLPLPVSVHIIGEVLKGLAYAHELCDPDGNPLRLVHRDVNPANVFLSYDGRVKLADFGVAFLAAKRQHGGELVGKPGYFAPEQLAGDAVDQRADLFSLGVMMFEMLTGSRLFAGDSDEEILKANKRAKIPKPSALSAHLPPELEAVILTALERKPEDRFPSARAMLQALEGFVPPPVGMPLAVAAVMRKLFLAEHIQELQLREGLSGVAMARGSGQVVVVATSDQRAQAAFHELLLSRGYRPEICPALDRLAAVLDAATEPALVLADVCASGFSPAAFIGAVARHGHGAPVVAVSDSLAPQWIHYADAIGAVDLLYKPFNVDRVLTALRAAITGTARVAPVDASPSLPPLGIRPHVLVVTPNPDLAVRLTRGLSERGLEADVSPNAAEAIERTDVASYHAVVYDAHPAGPEDREFPARLRGRPAMGLVPVVFLADPASHRLFARLAHDRVAVRPRDESPSEVAEILVGLLGDNRQGRVFVRYAVELPVEFRYGGRAFHGQSIDLSRGGLMMRSDQMPPVGTVVGVAIKLPGGQLPVDVSGRVMRVDILEGDNDRRPGVGIEFEHFSGRSEAGLIAFLGSLDRPGSPGRR